MAEHPFTEHELDPAGIKAAEHLLSCAEPWCVALRTRMTARARHQALSWATSAIAANGGDGSPAWQVVATEAGQASVTAATIESHLRRMEKAGPLTAMLVEGVREKMFEKDDLRAEDLAIEITEHGMVEAGNYECCVRIRHRPTGLVARAEGKSQLQAKSDALVQLRNLVAKTDG